MKIGLPEEPNRLVTSLFSRRFASLSVWVLATRQDLVTPREKKKKKKQGRSQFTAAFAATCPWHMYLEAPRSLRTRGCAAIFHDSLRGVPDLGIGERGSLNALFGVCSWSWLQPKRALLVRT